MQGLLILTVLTLLTPTFSQFCRNRPFYRSKLGNYSLTILSDGPVQFPAEFFLNVPALAVERSNKASFRRTNPGIVQINILIVDTPTHRVLFDTGAFTATQEVGDVFARAGLLFRHLKRAGISPDSIDAILLTHAHGDHSGGLLDEEGNRAFKNAKVYVGRIEHDFWTSEPFPEVPTGLDQETLSTFAGAYLEAIEPYLEYGQVEFVDDGDMPLPGMKFLFTPGHSPGHMALEVSSGDESLLFIGDAWISQPDQVQNPEWAFLPETNREAAYRSRLRLLERAARKGIKCVVYHEAFPGLGYIKKVGPAFDWIPEAGSSFGDDFCE